MLHLQAFNEQNKTCYTDMFLILYTASEVDDTNFDSAFHEALHSIVISWDQHVMFLFVIVY